MTTCECDPTEHLPCPDHLAVVVSREGAAFYTADELAAVFVEDVEELRPDVRPWDAAMSDAVDVAAEYRDAHPHGGWCDDPELGAALTDGIYAGESALADLGLAVWWDDGYVIGRVVGGPLSD